MQGFRVPKFEEVSDKDRLKKAYRILDTPDGQVLLAHWQWLVDRPYLGLLHHPKPELSAFYQAGAQDFVRSIERFVEGMFDPADLEQGGNYLEEEINYGE